MRGGGPRRGPGGLRWYWRTATGNDELVAGASGLGYVRPDQVPCGAHSAFTQRRSTYLNEARLTVVHLLDSSNTLNERQARRNPPRQRLRRRTPGSGTAHGGRGP